MTTGEPTMYDPTTGRWLSEDPLGFSAEDMNLYRYVSNDPTNAVDPSGLKLTFNKGPAVGADNEQYLEAIAKATKDALADPKLKTFLNSIEAKTWYGDAKYLPKETLEEMRKAPADTYDFPSVDKLVANVVFRLHIINAAFDLEKMRKQEALQFSERDPIAFNSPAFMRKLGIPSGEAGQLVTGIQTRDGVTPSNGLKAIMGATKGNPVSLDCTNSAIIAIHEGYRRWAGDAAYDQAIKGPLTLGASGAATPFLRQVGPQPTTPIPGDSVVWKVTGPDVRRSYRNGENSIYLGKSIGADPLYFGFPIGLLPQDDFTNRILERGKGTAVTIAAIIGVNNP
jgi:hypothetical protein